MWTWIRYTSATLSPDFDPTDPIHHQDGNKYTYTKGGRRRNPLTNRPYTQAERDAISAITAKPRFGDTTLSDLDDLKRLRKKYDAEPTLDEVTQLNELRKREQAEKKNVEAPSRPAPQHSPSTGRGHQIELWPDPLPSREPQASGINDRPMGPSLLQRAPGRALIDQMMQTDTPLPRRNPGQYAPPGPRRQTLDEWIQGLREKGIELGPDLKVPGAATDLPKRKPMPPRGRDIWGDLIYPERDGIIRAASVEWLNNCLASYSYYDNRDELGRFAPRDYRRPTQKTDRPGSYHHALREFGGDVSKALAWDRLRREHPDEPIGPDESYDQHFQRLKKKYQKGAPPKRQHNKIRPHVEKRKKSSALVLEYINKVLAGV